MTSNGILYISYSWEQESDTLVSRLSERFQNQGISYKRDKEQLAPRESITQFMEEIGTAENALIVLSDKYLKSEFCMYELNQLYYNSEADSNVFLDKTFFLILKNTNIYYAEDKQHYLSYWQQRINSLEANNQSKTLFQDIYKNLDAILSSIASLNIPPIDLETCDIGNISLDLQKWLNKTEEPKLELIKRILNAESIDLTEINSQKIKYPQSKLISLLEIALLFRKGIGFLNHDSSIALWRILNQILYSRDSLVYKTAFCFKLALYIEFFKKRNITTPDEEMTYRLSLGESQLIPEFLLGVELSKATHNLVRKIYKNY